MEKFTVTATKIHQPRDLYRVAQAPVEGKSVLYIEKNGRQVRAESILGLISLDIRAGDRVSVVGPDSRYTGSMRAIGELIGCAER